MLLGILSRIGIWGIILLGILIILVLFILLGSISNIWFKLGILFLVGDFRLFIPLYCSYLFVISKLKLLLLGDKIGDLLCWWVMYEFGKGEVGITFGIFGLNSAKYFPKYNNLISYLFSLLIKTSLTCWISKEEKGKNSTSLSTG